MTTDLYLRSGPEFEVDGSALAELERDVTWLDVADSTEGLKTLTASFIGSSHEATPGDTDYLDGRLDFGMELSCSIGPRSEHRHAFRGAISAIEVAYREGEIPIVTVRAEDALMKLRMTRRSHTYEDVTDADLVEAIANEHGLRAEVDAPGPTYDVVQQFNQSDLAFLRSRARLINAELWADADQLHLASRDRRTATELTLVRGNELIDVEGIADLAHVRSEVVVAGYDAFDRAAIDERATAALVSGAVTGGTSGVDILERSMGSRGAARVTDVPLASAEARAWAEAAMVGRGREFVTINGLTSGSADMIVGSQLTIQRMGTPFDGSGYVATAVRHTFDRIDGLRTRFCAQRASIGGPR